MKFSELAIYFQKLENTTSRNLMMEILADLFKKAEASEIDKICYLTQGRVAPLFVPLEFGMAEKMMIKAMASAYGMGVEKVENIFKKEGDMGKVAEELIESTGEPLRSPTQFFPVQNLTQDSLRSFRSSKIGGLPAARVRPLQVSEVFTVLEEIAQTSGSGSVERKTKLLSDLLKKVDSLSARYIVRIPLAKMRLGFSDMTVLDGLSWMLGKTKEARKEIEKAYNVRPDLGYIAKTVKEGQEGKEGIEGLEKIGPEIGTPILMARAERLSSGKEIVDKIGRCAIEPKLDGFRVQVHFSKFKIQNSKLFEEKLGLFESQDASDGVRRRSSEVEGSVRLFSRNLEDVTFMYPDIVEAVIKQIKVKEAIFEGEAIGWDEKNQKYLAFQETTQRRRKYHIKEMSKSVPLKLVVFDLLYVDAENLIDKPFLERRKRLEGIIKSA